MGCLARVGCLTVVAGAAVVGYWLYGDQLPSKLATAAGRAANMVGDAVADRTSGGTGTRGASRDSGRPAERSAAPDVDWVRVDKGAASPASITSLSKANGPAFVTLSAKELAGVLASALPRQLPKSASNVQLALRGNQMLMRTVLDVTDMAGDGTLGQLLGTALAGRDTLQMAGTLEPLRPGVAQYRVEALRIKGIQVPPRLIPTILGAVRRGAQPPELAPNGIGIVLPAGVADLRVSNGRLTLYKAVPSR